jgi:hypothetical protein
MQDVNTERLPRVKVGPMKWRTGKKRNVITDNFVTVWRTVKQPN